MGALGSRAAWDRTRVIEQTFAGKHKLLWDKVTVDLRLDEGQRVVLMNLVSGHGRLFEGAEEIVRSPDKKRGALDRAYTIWVEDSYCTAMPFKLKDKDATLRYFGEEKLEGDRIGDVLRLTFSHVGVTPREQVRVGHRARHAPDREVRVLQARRRRDTLR